VKKEKKKKKKTPPKNVVGVVFFFLFQFKFLRNHKDQSILKINWGEGWEKEEGGKERGQSVCVMFVGLIE